MWHKYASPYKLMIIAEKIFWPCVIIALILLPLSLYLALITSPPDYQQGDSVRIMYIHVPSAYMAVVIYASMALSSLAFLIWRHEIAHHIAQASAPIGAAFTFLCLITGSLWGKPMWGTWWVWDARLTSVLILFLIYLGYIGLSHGFDHPNQGRKSLAVLAILGAVNIPIIKFSVDWWNTLHQGASILRLDGPTIAPEMLYPLFSMIILFTLIYLILLIIRLKTRLLEAKIRTFHL